MGGTRDMRLKNKDDETGNGKKSNVAFHPCKQRLTPFSQLFFFFFFFLSRFAQCGLEACLTRENDLPDTCSNCVKATRWRRKITVWKKKKSTLKPGLGLL